RDGEGAIASTRGRVRSPDWVVSNKLGVLEATVTGQGAHWEQNLGRDRRLKEALIDLTDWLANLVTCRRNTLVQCSHHIGVHLRKALEFSDAHKLLRETLGLLRSSRLQR